MIQKHFINSKSLKDLRTKAGLTQADIAKLLDTKENYYGKVERDEVVPSLTMIQKLTKILKIASSDILLF
jgi:transcriptional regulator with XRE-family HTH domain